MSCDIWPDAGEYAVKRYNLYTLIGEPEQLFNSMFGTFLSVLLQADVSEFIFKADCSAVKSDKRL